MVRGIHLQVNQLEVREVPAGIDPSQLTIDNSNYDPTHVLVKWTDSLAHATKFTQDAESLGNGLFRLTLKPNVTVAQAVAGIKNSAGVAVAEPDYQVHIAEIPSDPSFGTQWDMSAINAPDAWNTSTGTGHTIVAVVDTGVDYSDPDLKANMWRDPTTGAYGWNYVSNTANAMDDNGHGTHVAGTIGAIGDNGVGIAGVDWHVKIMAVKVLDSTGTGYLSNIVKGINYAVAHGAKVINASFGGGGYDAATATAVTNAKAHGVIVVAAAGNDGTNIDTNPEYPASYSGDNVIAVAATDSNDKLASFSNYGPNTVDIAAPGVSIYSTLPKGKYGTYSGTSMAAPHVAGAMALVWDAHPTWNYQQVIQAVLKTADAEPGLTGKIAHGLLDVGKAIDYTFATPTPTPTPTPKDTTGASITKATFSGSGNSINQVLLTFSEAINPTTFTTSDATLIGPSGAKINIAAVKPVTGTGNTQFAVIFASQTTGGTYTLAVGPDIRDLAGNLMDQNQNGKNGEAADKFTTTTALSSSQTFKSANVGLPILDFVKLTSTLTITEDVSISDLNVEVNASHTYDGDVRMTLVAPDGTQVILFNHRGGSGNDFDNTIFDDQGANSIYKGTAPFAGSYKPEYVLSTFNGKSAKGTWKLVVEDTALFDSGKLNAWSLTIDGATRTTSTQPATYAANPAIPSQTSFSASMPSAPPVDRNGHIYVGLASNFVRL
jgi:serine protease